MQSPLGRIESEHIARELAETLPSLRLQFGDSCSGVAQGSYAIAGGYLELISPVSGAFDGRSVRVHFSHQRSSVSFASVAEIDSRSRFRARIPAEFSREEPRGASRDGARNLRSISFYLGQNALKAIPSRAFPLDDISGTIEFTPAMDSRMRALSAACGFPSDRFLMGYRLIEVLSVIRESESEEFREGSARAFFLDHRFALIMVPDDEKGRARRAASSLEDSLSPIEIAYPARTIHAKGAVRGILKVNEALSAVCLSLDEAHEEDRRFLFENLYRENYREN